jgi:hypothetical protein
MLLKILLVGILLLVLSGTAVAPGPWQRTAAHAAGDDLGLPGRLADVVGGD